MGFPHLSHSGTGDKEPVPGICDQIANYPMLVIEVEFFDLPNLSIKAA
jgi:hypothetical protein